MELNKYSKNVTQDPTHPAAQAMLYAIGLTEEDLKKDKKVELEHLNSEAKAWKNVWSAGQGVTSINNNLSTRELIDDLKEQFKTALSEHLIQSKKYL